LDDCGGVEVTVELGEDCDEEVLVGLEVWGGELSEVVGSADEPVDEVVGAVVGVVSC
jgi:hypothetical protein